VGALRHALARLAGPLPRLIPGPFKPVDLLFLQKTIDTRAGEKIQQGFNPAFVCRCVLQAIGLRM
jgi:hypothetical protein